MFNLKLRKKEKKEISGLFEDLKNRAIIELANFLMRRWHFSFEEALSASEEFWKKYERKINEVIGVG